MSSDIWELTLAPKAWAVPGEIVCNTSLSVDARMVYVILLGYASTCDGDIGHFPSNSELKGHLGDTINIQRAKEELFDRGLLEYVRDQDSNYIRYTFQKEGE